MEIKDGVLVKVLPADIKCGLLAIPEGVTDIGQFASFGRPELRKVILPKSLKTVGVGAFQKCSNLESVVLLSPNNLQFILSNAFSNCEKLYEFPFDKLSHIEKIGPYAFCATAFFRINFKRDGAQRLETGAFSNMKNLEYVNLGCNPKFVDSYCFSHCYNLKEITFLSEDTVFEENVFYLCDKIERMTIYSPPSAIDERTFDTVPLFTLITKDCEYIVPNTSLIPTLLAEGNKTPIPF